LAYQVAGALSGNEFNIQSDGAGGTDLILSPEPASEPPHLTAPSSLSVTAGKSVSLGIIAAPVDSDDILSVTINGVPGYETITAGPGEIVTHKGGTYTVTSTVKGASISDLTLNSFYQGKGHPIAQLTVTASNATAGETGQSPSKVLTVIDPPSFEPNGGATANFANQFESANHFELDNLLAVSAKQVQGLQELVQDLSDGHNLRLAALSYSNWFKT
jgi:hypothetical protein